MVHVSECLPNNCKVLNLTPEPQKKGWSFIFIYPLIKWRLLPSLNGWWLLGLHGLTENFIVCTCITTFIHLSIHQIFVDSCPVQALCRWWEILMLRETPMNSPSTAYRFLEKADRSAQWFDFCDNATKSKNWVSMWWLCDTSMCLYCTTFPRIAFLFCMFLIRLYYNS
jgi:hypothetical protein